jgi:hypothetical protein
MGQLYLCIGLILNFEVADIWWESHEGINRNFKLD